MQFDVITTLRNQEMKTTWGGQPIQQNYRRLWVRMKEALWPGAAYPTFTDFTENIQKAFIFFVI